MGPPYFVPNPIWKKPARAFVGIPTCFQLSWVDDFHFSFWDGLQADAVHQKNVCAGMKPWDLLYSETLEKVEKRDDERVFLWLEIMCPYSEKILLVKWASLYEVSSKTFQVIFLSYCRVIGVSTVTDYKDFVV